jgi:hypothetical protein
VGSSGSIVSGEHSRSNGRRVWVTTWPRIGGSLRTTRLRTIRGFKRVERPWGRKVCQCGAVCYSRPVGGKCERRRYRPHGGNDGIPLRSVRKAERGGARSHRTARFGVVGRSCSGIPDRSRKHVLECHPRGPNSDGISTRLALYPGRRDGDAPSQDVPDGSKAVYARCAAAAAAAFLKTARRSEMRLHGSPVPSSNEQHHPPAIRVRSRRGSTGHRFLRELDRLL